MSNVNQFLKTIHEDPETADLLLEATAEVQLTEKMIGLRLEAGLTQAELAKKLGVSQAFIAKLESGGYDKAGIGTIRKVAVALNHDLNIPDMFVSLKHSYAALGPSRVVFQGQHPVSFMPTNVCDFLSALEARKAAVG